VRYRRVVGATGGARAPAYNATPSDFCIKTTKGNRGTP